MGATAPLGSQREGPLPFPVGDRPPTMSGMGVIVVGSVAQLLLLGLTIALVYRRRSWLPGVTHRSVAVVTATDTLRGVLVGVYTDVLVLTAVSVLGEPPQPLEGEISVPRSQVIFVQDIAPTSVAA